MDMQNGHAAWAFSIYMQQGPAAWTNSLDYTAVRYFFVASVTPLPWVADLDFWSSVFSINICQYKHIETITKK
jgi:hypothetical protein